MSYDVIIIKIETDIKRLTEMIRDANLDDTQKIYLEGRLSYAKNILLLFDKN